MQHFPTHDVSNQHTNHNFYDCLGALGKNSFDDASGGLFLSVYELEAMYDREDGSK